MKWKCEDCGMNVETVGDKLEHNSIHFLGDLFLKFIIFFKRRLKMDLKHLLVEIIKTLDSLMSWTFLISNVLMRLFTSVIIIYVLATNLSESNQAIQIIFYISLIWILSPIIDTVREVIKKVIKDG